MTQQDRRAWVRMQVKVGLCRCDETHRAETPQPGCPLAPWMLMYHESDERCAFKHSITRKYTYA